MPCSTEEGRHHAPLEAHYRPQFFFHTTHVPGDLDLGGRDQVMSGDTLDPVTVTLGKSTALEPGMGFAVRQGNRTVAADTVTEILD